MRAAAVNKKLSNARRGKSNSMSFYYQERAGFDLTAPRQWAAIEASQAPSEVWWIQSFRGDFGNYSLENMNADAQAFKNISENYIQADVFNYVPQDPGIAILKEKFLDQEDYEYRVIVYRFVSPEQ